MSYLRAHDEHTLRDGWFSMSYLTIESFLGTIEVESCDQCPALWVHCACRINRWNDAGTILTCQLCGADGT